MTSYDKQYEEEPALFGQPYPEFEAFVGEHGKQEGEALDLGCGQGRDALMLARHGYRVTAVDFSGVGVSQMVAQARAENLPVTGVVGDIFEFPLQQRYDAIVLDSIIHFGKKEREQELQLLNRLPDALHEGGYLFLFVHKVDKKVRELNRWLDEQKNRATILEKKFIDYTYEEKSSGFTSSSQFYMVILQRL